MDQPLSQIENARLSSITEQSNQQQNQMPSTIALLKICHQQFLIHYLDFSILNPITKLKEIQAKIKQQNKVPLQHYFVFSMEKTQEKKNKMIELIKKKDIKKVKVSKNQNKLLSNKEVLNMIKLKNIKAKQIQSENSKNYYKLIQKEIQKRNHSTMAINKVQKHTQIDIDDLIQRLDYQEKKKNEIKNIIYSIGVNPQILEKWKILHSQIKSNLQSLLDIISQGKSLLELYSNPPTKPIRGKLAKQVFGLFERTLNSCYLDESMQQLKQDKYRCLKYKSVN